jgi:acyl-CoA reductase-like NAD-dependent aldehyde dehydrogenase
LEQSLRLRQDEGAGGLAGFLGRHKVRRAALPAGLLAALALAVGCGGEGRERVSKAEYEQKVRAVYGDVRAAFQSVGVEAKSLEDVARQIKAAQDELRDAANELERIEPPESVREPNEELAEGMRAYADDLDRLREAAENGDAELVSGLRETVVRSESIERMAEAAEEMIHRGYNLGPLQPE